MKTFSKKKYGRVIPKCGSGELKKIPKFEGTELIKTETF
jgi:hypothetical protein